MELERLRILIEATTGDSATQVGRLNKVLEQHAGTLKLAEKAAQTAARAEQLHEQGVTQASRAILKGYREQQAAAKARLSAGNAVLASMNRAAAAEAKAKINQDGLRKAIENTTAAARRADTVFAQVDRHLAQSATTAGKAAGGQKSVGDAFFGAMQKAFFFMSAVDRVHAALGKLYDATEEAARTNAAKMYFDDAGKSLEKLRAVSKGQISDSNLIKKSNLADSMGIGEDTFGRLIQVAQAASAKTGQAFDHMFDSIVLGTARSSRLLLDNLGIIVNVKEAHLEYAKELIRKGEIHGKTAREVAKNLTAEGKQAAFLHALYKATNGQIEQLNKLGQGGAGIFDRFAASAANLKQALMETLLPAVTKVLTALTEAFDKMTGLLRLRNVQERAIASSPGGLKMGAFGSSVQVGGTTFEFDASLPDKMGQVLVEKMREIRTKSGDQFAGHNIFDDTGKVSQELWAFGSRLRTGSGEFGVLLHQVEQLNAVLQKFKERHGKPAEAGVPQVDFSGSDDKGKKLKGDEWIPHSQIANKEDPGTTWSKWHEDEMKAQAKARAALDRENAIREKAVAKYKERVEKADQQYIEMQHEEVGLFKKFFEDLAKAVAEAAERLDSAMAGIVNGVSSVAQGGGIGAAFGGMAGGALAAAVGLPPQTGAAIGDMFGQLLDKLPGMARIAQAVSDGFQKMMVIALEPLMGILIDLAEPIYQLLLAFGVLTKSSIDPLLMVFRLLIPIVAGVIRLLAGVIIALAPFLGIITALTQTFGLLAHVLLIQFLAGLLSMFPGMGEMGDWVRGMRSGIEWFTESVVEGGVKFHNGILGLIRNIPGMEDFGTMLQASDFEWDDGEGDGPTEDNTDAINENTRAVRDLAREFHNLPSGYKGNAAMYNATNREAPFTLRNPTLRGQALDRIAETALSSPSRRWNPYRG